MNTQKSWYNVGFSDGREGKDFRPPEHYSARNQYREGWEKGRLERVSEYLCRE